jgi:hypothetical protein
MNPARIDDFDNSRCRGVVLKLLLLHVHIRGHTNTNFRSLVPLSSNNDQRLLSVLPTRRPTLSPGGIIAWPEKPISSIGHTEETRTGDGRGGGGGQEGDDKARRRRRSRLVAAAGGRRRRRRRKVTKIKRRQRRKNKSGARNDRNRRRNNNAKATAAATSFPHGKHVGKKNALCVRRICA